MAETREKNSRSVAAIAVLLCAFLLLPAAASAGCAPGQTPNDGDIESIAVSRAGFPILSRPSYQFRFDRTAPFFVPPSTGYYATLTARESVPLKGNYVLRESGPWMTFVGILERDGFYSLRLTPNPKFALLDPPNDSVSVTRCKVTTSISLASTLQGVVEDGSFKRYLKLLDDMQTAIFALPWVPVPAPSPTASP